MIHSLLSPLFSWLKLHSSTNEQGVYSTGPCLKLCFTKSLRHMEGFFNAEILLFFLNLINYVMLVWNSSHRSLFLSLLYITRREMRAYLRRREFWIGAPNFSHKLGEWIRLEVDAVSDSWCGVWSNVGSRVNCGRGLIKWTDEKRHCFFRVSSVLPVKEYIYCVTNDAWIP